MHHLHHTLKNGLLMTWAQRGLLESNKSVVLGYTGSVDTSRDGLHRRLRNVLSFRAYTAVMRKHVVDEGRCWIVGCTARLIKLSMIMRA